MSNQGTIENSLDESPNVSFNPAFCILNASDQSFISLKDKNITLVVEF